MEVGEKHSRYQFNSEVITWAVFWAVFFQLNSLARLSPSFDKFTRNRDSDKILYIEKEISSEDAGSQ